jgi:hypothetical protein
MVRPDIIDLMREAILAIPGAAVAFLITLPFVHLGTANAVRRQALYSAEAVEVIQSQHQSLALLRNNG